MTAMLGPAIDSATPESSVPSLRLRSGWFRPWLLVACAALCGCSGDDGPLTVPVTGRILYNGEPVEGAGVIFSPPEGPMAAGQTDANGVFRLTTSTQEGAIPAEHTVTVTKQEVMDEKQYAEYLARQKAGLPTSPPKSLLPAKYSNPMQSDLKATVTVEGPNDFEFNL